MERYAFRYRYDVTSTAYTFTDKPLTVTHTHTASGKDSRTEAYTYSYDHADRLLKVEHTLGGAKVTLAAYAYDNLGRLQSKSLHGSDADRQAYAYNVRGWLTGVSGTKFTQNLYYNTGNGPAKYNGSISSMTWKAGTASTVRGYKFTYDGLNRMLNATYGETAGISTNANRFSENVTGYDKNGNIKSLQRYGQTGASAYGLLDNLTFTLNGNQLSRVEDAVSTAAYGTNTAFVNGASAAGEYAYDVNGNLTKDLNKGITDIQYNVLNLPSTVSFSDGSTITYTYGADGTKLRTVHKIGSTTTTTDYCGNVIYENGTQKLLLTEEGYINLTGTQQYHYYLKDHQGNNRVVINQSGTVEETNHYYPFGGVFGTTGNTQPYKYNGKEFDTKKGLNWYDYGARHYDAALGRFTTNDRFAEKYYSMSPYQYGANNPVNNIDVNGDTIVVNPNPNGLIDNVKMFFGFDTKYQKDVKADLQQLKKDDKEIGEMIIELEKSKNVHSITRTKRGESNSSGFDREKAKKDIPQGSIINYDPDVKTDINGNHRTPRIGLIHELQHSSDVDKGIMSYENIGNQDSNATGLSTIYSIINEEQKPIYNKEELYQKDLKESGNNINYTFKYNYNIEDFVNSTIINTCFENKEIEEIDNYYSIKLSGNFYCLYNKKINIAVTSNLKVASNNADKIKDNTYIWTIDKNTTDIELVVDKNTPYTKPIKRGISSTFRIVCFIVLVVLSSLAYILYKKKNSSEI